MKSNLNCSQNLEKLVAAKTAANNSLYNHKLSKYAISLGTESERNGIKLAVSANDSQYSETLTDTSKYVPSTEFRVKRLFGCREWVYAFPPLEPHLYPEPIKLFRQRLADRLGMTQEKLWGDIEHFFGHRRGIREGLKDELNFIILSRLVHFSGGEITRSGVDKCVDDVVKTGWL